MPSVLLSAAPVEIFDAIRFEFGHAVARRAVHRRNPERVQTIFANRVADSFAVRRVANLAAGARIALDYSSPAAAFQNPES